MRDAGRKGPPRRDCRGVSLLEVLISLLILSIGLLGLAGLQTASLQYNTSAYHRTQATALAYGLADRMRGNREAALDDGAYDTALADPAPSCAGGTPAGGTPAHDLTAWRNALACRLPLGNGSVVQNGTVFTITVQWDDSRGRRDPERFELVTAL